MSQHNIWENSDLVLEPLGAQRMFSSERLMTFFLAPDAGESSILNLLNLNLEYCRPNNFIAVLKGPRWEDFKFSLYSW